MMTNDQARVVRAMGELCDASTPCTLRAIANSLGLGDSETSVLIDQLLSQNAVVKTPIEVRVLAPGGAAGVIDAYWLMVPDSIYNAEDVLSRWAPDLR